MSITSGIQGRGNQITTDDKPWTLHQIMNTWGYCRCVFVSYLAYGQLHIYVRYFTDILPDVNPAGIVVKHGQHSAPVLFVDLFQYSDALPKEVLELIVKKRDALPISTDRLRSIAEFCVHDIEMI